MGRRFIMAPRPQAMRRPKEFPVNASPQPRTSPCRDQQQQVHFPGALSALLRAFRHALTLYAVASSSSEEEESSSLACSRSMERRARSSTERRALGREQPDTMRRMSVRVMMDCAAPSSDTTYTRCRRLVEMRLTSSAKEVFSLVVSRRASGNTLPTSWPTGCSSRPNLEMFRSRRSDTAMEPISLLVLASVMPTALLWSMAMWWKATRAGVSEVTVDTTVRARPRSSTEEATPDRPFSASRPTMSSWVTTSVGTQAEAPSFSEPAVMLTTVGARPWPLITCEALAGSHT
mmetsp:Transcript_12252/g.29872  ORF Transcript_12252/g.29872 Transcript_12252/m.29872 type:complete len:290 (+) Transcript_12252:385-1254(+)